VDDLHDLEADLILLSARGTRLVTLRDGSEFAIVVLDRGDVESLLRHRSRHAARRIGEAVRRARIAVESGQA
jgi:hypothetical protein